MNELPLLSVNEIEKLSENTIPDAYKAAVLGATGVVGSELVKSLVESTQCREIKTFGRRKSEKLEHSKIIQHVIEMDVKKIEAQTLEALKGCEVAFITMGVGQPSKSNPEEMYKIDVEIPAAFARSAKKAGVKHISLLSSVGVKHGSKLFAEGPPDDKNASTRAGGELYHNIKSQIQDALCSEGFEKTSIFQPSMLVTEKARFGLWEAVAHWLSPKLHWIMPTKYHEVRVSDLGRAMRLNAEKGCALKGNYVLQREQFTALLK